MHSTRKPLIVIILILLSMGLSFAVPINTKYEGASFIPDLKLYNTLPNWQGSDVSKKLNIGDERYNFIGEILAYKYVNTDGGELLFFVLNARDFHYPNVCFTSSGFKVTELKDTEFHASGHTVRAYTVYTERFRKKAKITDRYLVFYWIVIDKKVVTNWVEQKVKQLYFSLFNKKNVGLIVRLDIPVEGNNVEAGFTLAKQFINDISQTFTPEQADYLFGEK